MQDNLSECDNTLRVMLRYDYNTMRADMFHDHVEEATVYVVDPLTGTVVDQQTVANSVPGGSPDGSSAGPGAASPLRSPSFAFSFDGLAPGSYRLYATGRSKADAAFSIVTPAIADAMDKLQFTVPSTVSGQWSTVNSQRLDTLWNTLKPIDVIVSESEPTEATVPLMRLTNDLNIMVFRRDGSLDNGHERYDVIVTDETITFGYDNEPTADGLTQGQTLQYRPFAAWTTETIVPGSSSQSVASQGQSASAETDSIAERNAHYDLSLARLIAHDDARRNARLIITNRETGHEIVNIDLCYYLALARNAFEMQHYSTQEYLDREYDYRLDFGFDGSGSNETWKYMNIRINVLSWALRIQNEEL